MKYASCLLDIFIPIYLMAIHLNGLFTKLKELSKVVTLKSTHVVVHMTISQTVNGKNMQKNMVMKKLIRYTHRIANVGMIKIFTLLNVNFTRNSNQNSKNFKMIV